MVRGKLIKCRSVGRGLSKKKKKSKVGVGWPRKELKAVVGQTVKKLEVTEGWESKTAQTQGWVAFIFRMALTFHHHFKSILCTKYLIYLINQR